MNVSKFYLRPGSSSLIFLQDRFGQFNEVPWGGGGGDPVGKGRGDPEGGDPEGGDPVGDDPDGGGGPPRPRAPGLGTFFFLKQIN